jgi:hypothetical protein
LYNGECVESCPAGYTEFGSGSFNRECIDNRRRSILGASANAQTNHASASITATVSALSITAMVVGVIFVIVGRRQLLRQQDVLPTADEPDRLHSVTAQQ